MTENVFFEFQKIATNVDILPRKIWKPHPNDELWEVSNLGRVRIDGKIQEQIDNPDDELLAPHLLYDPKKTSATK